MNCTQCKRELQTNWNYCPDCGEAVKQVSKIPTSQDEIIWMEKDLDDYPMGFDPDLYDL
jgi:predicted amidophosphoribosyltransferase